MEKQRAEGTEEQDVRIRRVWVGEADRIASFHAVEGYRQETFHDRDALIGYLRRLQECGFRFQ